MTLGSIVLDPASRPMLFDGSTVGLIEMIKPGNGMKNGAAAAVSIAHAVTAIIDGRRIIPGFSARQMMRKIGIRRERVDPGRRHGMGSRL